MYQNRQFGNVTFFWHQICWVSRIWELQPIKNRVRYEENEQEDEFHIRIPRRKYPIFKLPALIQFQVTADSKVIRFPEPHRSEGLDRPAVAAGMTD
jgi:hypothetical protein